MQKSLIDQVDLIENSIESHPFVRQAIFVEKNDFTRKKMEKLETF